MFFHFSQQRLLVYSWPFGISFSSAASAPFQSWALTSFLRVFSFLTSSLLSFKWRSKHLSASLLHLKGLLEDLSLTSVSPITTFSSTEVITFFLSPASISSVVTCV